jgi:Fe-S cluster biogenesis protein NfuA
VALDTSNGAGPGVGEPPRGAHTPPGVPPPALPPARALPGNGLPMAQPQVLVERVQELMTRSEQLDDPGVRELVQDLTAAIMDLYGEGLARIGAALQEAGPAGAELRARLLEDGVVASLLVMHDLHPVTLEERVTQALDSVRPYMESHAGGVELLGIEEGRARLRLQGHCHGCAASQATLESTIRAALEEYAPDLLDLEVEGVAESVVHPAPGPCAAPGAVELPMVAAGELPGEPAFTLSMVVSAAAPDEPRPMAVAAADPQPAPAPLATTVAAPVPSPESLSFGMTPPPELLSLAARELPAPVAAAPGAARKSTAQERCELCEIDVPREHRHLLKLDERRILCVCHTCLALRSGDADYRPTGTRVVWLEDFDLEEETWSELGIPVGLAFFLNSSSTKGIAALYPSPAGTTECELPLDAWERMAAANPLLSELEPDAEALIVNRLADPPQHVIVPIDQCYRLVGLIKSRWEGISGGAAIATAVPEFFAELAES